jgi:hypothetical protein
MCITVTILEHLVHVLHSYYTGTWRAYVSAETQNSYISRCILVGIGLNLHYRVIKHHPVTNFFSVSWYICMYVCMCVCVLTYTSIQKSTNVAIKVYVHLHLHSKMLRPFLAMIKAHLIVISV